MELVEDERVDALDVIQEELQFRNQVRHRPEIDVLFLFAGNYARYQHGHMLEVLDAFAPLLEGHVMVPHLRVTGRQLEKVND